MKKIIVNTGRADAQCDIEKVEAKYNAKWVGQLAMKTAGGGWSGDSCGDVYYQETPPVEGYSNYFALIIQNGRLYITSGAPAAEGIINGVIAKDGEIIYSRYRHDMRHSADMSTFIDGGRDYVRGGATGQYINMKIVDGEWYQLEDSDLLDDEDKDEGESKES